MPSAVRHLYHRTCGNSSLLAMVCRCVKLLVVIRVGPNGILKRFPILSCVLHFCNILEIAMVDTAKKTFDLKVWAIFYPTSSEFSYSTEVYH